MAVTLLTLNDPFSPHILAAEKDFLVAYKPPRVHSAPDAHSGGASFFEWCALQFPEIAEPAGRKAGEGGLLHRLDYETQGLMLIARNPRAFESLVKQQKEKTIVKEYSALTAEAQTSLPGFPLWRGGTDFPLTVTSAFRAYGIGRKAVRPVTDDTAWKGKPSGQYISEILDEREIGSGILSLRVRIFTGFRHQIRCHLAWIGRPILNDKLYGTPSFGKGFLGLRACSLSFTDPCSGAERMYAIPALSLDEL